MAHEYLMKEYELTYSQLRYYDDRHSSILTYLFSLTSAVATAQFAVYKFLEGATAGFYACQSLLSGLVFIITLLLFLAMLQNRLYFVFAARQLNAIRGFLMKVAAPDFDANQMYTSTDFPALKPMSVHSFQLMGAALISALFAGSSVYAYGPATGDQPSIVLAVTTLILVTLAELVVAVKYLNAGSKKSADGAVHDRVDNSSM